MLAVDLRTTSNFNIEAVFEGSLNLKCFACFKNSSVTQFQSKGSLISLLGLGMCISWLLFCLCTQLFRSTGSIVALAIGVLDWSVDECIKKFTELCQTAFTKRKSYLAFRSKIPTTIFRGSMYKTQPLYESLRSSLGDHAIFGGIRNKSRHCYDTKVAITSTDEFAQNAIILANYNRQGEDYAHHVFQRPRDPNEELKLWEAAAASTAAPPYIIAFRHPETDQGYLDGALYNNNPARVAYREARLLWHDISRLPPDVLVSIGTGKERDTDEETDRQWNFRKSSPALTGAYERQGDLFRRGLKLLSGV